MSSHEGQDNGTYLDLYEDTSQHESQSHRDPMVEELVEELRDRVAFLERPLERRSIEAERYQQIVAGLTQTNNNLSARVLELEAPVETPASHQPGETAAETAANGAPGTRARRATRALRTALGACRGGVGCSAGRRRDRVREPRARP